MNRTPAAGLLLLALIGSGCRHTDPAAGTKSAPPMRVEVVPARVDTLAVPMQFIGETEGIAKAVIQPRVSGYLIRKNYRNGMPVKRGQLLYEIDPGPLSTQLLTAEANLRSAEAQALEARNNFNRAVPLARINAISQSQLDQYTAAWESARASVHAAQQQLRNARLQVGYTKIYAPMDGVIGYTSATVGDYVGVGTQYSVLNTISNIDSVQVALSIPVARYLRLRGEAHPSYDNAALLGRIRLFLSDGTEYPYPGTYDYTQQDAGNETGTIRIVVDFPNPEHLLKAGLFARVTANAGVPRPRLVVPQRSVMQTQGVDAVWVVGSDRRVAYRAVKLGDTYGTEWIVEEGLRPGELVLVDGLQKVRSGETVEPVETR